ncbi:alpha/beta family hydrolase [Gilvimarinus sp. 1_MG-2023]|uniref:alpha/beta family hydrolase n=1 Tax=Gilvimarinus sp. 1_MG-2023 TaxID=3062638 RepID=UPI0026E40E53|nr:alpha/beta family hydrolase [Gilvimarinus sp. 1_MG-2023]MDO6747353.1 dienelactone hydrolase family protein [Gilvimarinus sp. 1_MG-2023]
MPDFLIDRAVAPRAVLVLAHGAGAPMDSDFMQQVAEGFCRAGITVYRFEFPYMRERRLHGTKRPPNRQPELISAWQQALIEVTAAETLPVFIGGKSMGGRMACILAGVEAVSAVVCFGYPFHPPGKPDKTRLTPLQQSRCPVFIAQGSRDKLGSAEDIADYQLGNQVTLHWLEDGDHDLKPRVRSGFTHDQHIQGALRAATGFIDTYL